MDIECCDCCGAPHESSDIRKVDINQACVYVDGDTRVFTTNASKFKICESCDNELIGTVWNQDNVDKLLNDASQGFDIYAMQESGNSLRYLKALGVIWYNYGINAPE